MFSPQTWQELRIERIVVAHPFVLNKAHRCEYPNGRGVYGLVYALSGQAEYRFSTGETCQMQPGDLLFLAPTAAYTIDVHHEFRHYTINFELNRQSSLPYSLLRAPAPELYAPRFHALCTAWQTKRIGNELRAIGLLYEMMAQFVQDGNGRAQETAAHLRLRPARQYLEEHACESVTLEQLAHLCSMSVTNFRREWARLHGGTPMQYRDELRLLRAREYLASGYYGVGEVAQRLGFEDVGYFVRFFKKHVGISPGRFKANTANYL